MKIPKNHIVILNLSLLLILSSAFIGCIDLDEDDGAEIEMEILEAETRTEDLDGDAPLEGQIFLYLNVSIKNFDDEQTISADPSHFTIETEKGNEYEYHDYNYDEFPFFIGAGNREYFWISYEIDENETGSELVFEPFAFAEEDVYNVEIPSYE